MRTLEPACVQRYGCSSRDFAVTACMRAVDHKLALQLYEQAGCALVAKPGTDAAFPAVGCRPESRAMLAETQHQSQPLIQVTGPGLRRLRCTKRRAT